MLTLIVTGYTERDMDTYVKYELAYPAVSNMGVVCFVIVLFSVCVVLVQPYLFVCVSFVFHIDSLQSACFCLNTSHISLRLTSSIVCVCMCLSMQMFICN